MPIQLLLRLPAHGAMPGASDEILALAFTILALLAGWWILKQHG